jgi:hypothetical protein
MLLTNLHAWLAAIILTTNSSPLLPAAACDVCGLLLLTSSGSATRHTVILLPDMAAVAAVLSECSCPSKDYLKLSTLPSSSLFPRLRSGAILLVVSACVYPLLSILAAATQSPLLQRGQRLRGRTLLGGQNQLMHMGRGYGRCYEIYTHPSAQCMQHTPGQASRAGLRPSPARCS